MNMYDKPTLRQWIENCVNGFRICDLETGDVIFAVVPKYGHTSKKGVAEIWGRENDFDDPLYEGDWKGALEWFGV